MDGKVHNPENAWKVLKIFRQDSHWGLPCFSLFPFPAPTLGTCLVGQHSQVLDGEELYRKLVSPPVIKSSAQTCFCPFSRMAICLLLPVGLNLRFHVRRHLWHDVLGGGPGWFCSCFTSSLRHLQISLTQGQFRSYMTVFRIFLWNICQVKTFIKHCFVFRLLNILNLWKL